MDTTSLCFTGAGGATLGARGHSKDHRPDLQQMILGVVNDAAGRPVCTEMWPGNTADVGALLPIIDRLRGRFSITPIVDEVHGKLLGALSPSRSCERRIGG